MAIAIAIAYFAILSIAVGIYSQRKVKKASDFNKSSGGLSWIMVTFAFVLIPLGAGHTLNLWQSSITLGASVMWWGILTGGVFLPLMMLFLGPWLRQTGLDTFPQVMQRIFGPLLGKFHAAITVATWTGIGASETIATGTAIFGLSNGKIPFYPWCIVIAVVLILVYVLFGGVLQMSVLNTVNAIVMIVGSYTALFMMVGWLGANAFGLQGVKDFYDAAGQYTFLQNFDFSPGVIFEIIIPVVVLHVTAAAVAPNNTTPFFSARSDADCRKGVFLGAAINGMASIPWVVFALVGMSLPVIINALPADQVATLVPIQLAMESLPVPILAIMMISLLAASLSTGGSIVLGNGIVVAKDIIEPFFAKMSDKGKLINMRICMIICCLLFAAPALIVPVVFPVFLWCFSFGIPLFVVYIMGLWVKISKPAAWITIVVTYIINFVWTFAPLNIEGPMGLNMYPVTISSVVLGVILPLILPGEPGMLRAKKLAEKAGKAAK